MTKRKTAIIIGLLLSSTTAIPAEPPSMLVEGGASALIFDITGVALEVSDQVKDGCMPRPASVRASAEAALRRNNLSIVPEESSFLSPAAKITVLGYGQTENSCVVHFSLDLIKYVGANVPLTSSLDASLRTTIAPVTWGIYSTILSGSKSQMQDRIEREAEKSANDLFITIERAKDRIKTKWPAVWNASYPGSNKQ